MKFTSSLSNFKNNFIGLFIFGFASVIWRHRGKTNQYVGCLVKFHWEHSLDILCELCHVHIVYMCRKKIKIFTRFFISNKFNLFQLKVFALFADNICTQIFFIWRLLKNKSGIVQDRQSFYIFWETCLQIQRNSTGPCVCCHQLHFILDTILELPK